MSLFTDDMLSKPNYLPAVFAASLFSFLLVGESYSQAPPAPAAPVAAPAAPEAPPTGGIFEPLEKAFAAKEYPKAIAEIQRLLKLVGANPDAPLEMLYFHIGLANLLDQKYPEAEAAFEDCAKRFPKGEFTSRAYLGAGRACMLQDTPQKYEKSLNLLKLAAADPQYRSEAGLWLGQVLNNKLNKPDEALAVFRSLMGSDVSSPQQTTAAVEVIGLLAATGKLEDLSAYLDRLSHQAGVRNAIAWFANQVVVRGDELFGGEKFDEALIIYRSVPSRAQILEIQSTALAAMRKTKTLLEARVQSDNKLPIKQRSNATELLSSLTPAIELADSASKAIEEKADLDAALLMRRGRCLFYLNRFEEAMVCFRAIRTKYPDVGDAKAAAYAEILILNKLKNMAEIKERCEYFMQKYPDSDQTEEVATLAGEVMVQSGDWKEVNAFYRGLEAKFPNSESMDRFVFFQGVSFFQEANFAESAPIFAKFLKTFPNSELMENALYYVAMSNFLNNKYKETLSSIKDYLLKFPDGFYVGDMRYRLAFIDFNDKGPDDGKDDAKALAYRKAMSKKIIKDLGDFLKERPGDAANGSMFCLMGDTYKREEQMAEAIDAYKKAVETQSPDDVLQYALDNATSLLKANKDWGGVAQIHGDFLKRFPDGPLALLSAMELAKNKMREGKALEAAEMLADILKTRIADPASEPVESLIDEIVKSLVPKKKLVDLKIEEIDKQLTDILQKVVEGKENGTTAARIYYARARLAQMLKRTDLADLYLKGIATNNAKDPSVLSPALLALSGEILLKAKDLDGAEKMFRRLIDKYKNSSFSDAGPVGMGLVALARNKPDEALKIFDDVLENSAGTSRFKEATIGKLEALVALGKFDSAEKLAQQVVGDKSFRGEFSGKAYLVLGESYRKNAKKLAGDEATEMLKKAHAIYQRTYLAQQGYPDVCSEAYWQAYETAKELGEAAIADETLKALAEHPKLQKTARCIKAREQLGL
ncbi:MAG: tetratricopeptide repeat protein [Gloeobacteraceae cyanobacterium ES-bin-144]|nr:tetratricopeptide repeat protein [Verrucomicrobiales bacterium]